MPAAAPDPAIAAPATWSLASAPGTSALAVIEVTGDVDAALVVCGIKPVAVGEVGLRDFFGLDAGVVARYSVAHAHLMPHGGPAVVRGMLAGLTRAGITPSHDPQYPEAHSTNEGELPPRPRRQPDRRGRGPVTHGQMGDATAPCLAATRAVERHRPAQHRQEFAGALAKRA
jgi:hypothetical protein